MNLIDIQIHRDIKKITKLTSNTVLFALKGLELPQLLKTLC